MQGMDNFKMLVITTNFGELVKAICKTAKFGFAKSVDLF
jgi:hypothetical protein